MYHNYSLTGPRDTDDVFKVMVLKVKVTDNIFENALLGVDIAINSLLLKTFWFSLVHLGRILPV